MTLCAFAGLWFIPTSKINESATEIYLINNPPRNRLTPELNGHGSANHERATEGYLKCPKPAHSRQSAAAILMSGCDLGVVVRRGEHRGPFREGVPKDRCSERFENDVRSGGHLLL